MKVHSLYIFYIDASTTGKCKHSELLYLSTLHWVLCCLPDRVGSLSRTQHKYRVKHISRSTTIVDIHLTRLQTKKKCKSICLRLTIRILWSVVCFPCARTYPTPNRPVDSPPFLYPKCQSVTPTITHVLNPTPSRWRCKQSERERKSECTVVQCTGTGTRAEFSLPLKWHPQRSLTTMVDRRYEWLSTWYIYCFD